MFDLLRTAHQVIVCSLCFSLVISHIAYMQVSSLASYALSDITTLKISKSQNLNLKISNPLTPRIRMRSTQFILFDYGWHTRLCLVIFAITGFLWVGWTVVRPLQYKWKIVVSIVGTYMVASFEIFDFPPISIMGGAWLDAHALWHGCCIPFNLLSWIFLVEDTRFYLMEHQKQDV